MNGYPLGFWIIAWLAVAATVILVYWRKRARSAGLVYAYLVNFLLLHWLGAALYLLPWRQVRDIEPVQLGLIQSTYGVVAFAIGCLMIAPAILRYLGADAKSAPVHQTSDLLYYSYLIVGGSSYALVLFSRLGQIPSLSSLVAACQQFLLVGLCLLCRKYWLARKYGYAALWAGLGFVLPFFTIVTAGFLGFGALACFTMLCFLSTLVRRRWQLLAGGLILGFLSLSLFVSYTRDRNEIRRSVWGQEAYSDRVGRVASMLARFEWFDPEDDAQLKRIDGRMNQDFVVGLAVKRMATQTNYANGETIVDALLAMVPRAIWPEKPISAGSGDLVSRYTGLFFAAGTSVGIGHVMEFYINFGTPGVILGLMFLGTALTCFDQMAGSRLQNGNTLSFAVWYLAGMSMLNVGGSLVEMTAAAAASVIAGWSLNQLVLYQYQRRIRRGAQMARRPQPVRNLRVRPAMKPVK